ncbi:ADP-forming succinate--CoA ligase subunit beta [Blattabacterium cuenoti]|uniref:ADP-forming succinate--CoA ligase subunit beta n=1 Tax=Blattabacterium cuenoti TaxID=1653831 RepID=UPI00163BA1E8|nr:ADP-forming succinate--CoA ligase subunit beta [Blattabacterium cuenoti]
MNLYEYQGIKILKYFSIHVPEGIIATSPEESVKAAKILFKKTNKKSLVIKAQIHAGGRGKSGGIQLIKSLDEAYEVSKNILGKYLITPQTSKKGILVKKILISEDVYYNNNPKEYYISISLNRNIGKNVIIYSQEGGINIEDLSKNNPKKIQLEEIDPILGLQFFQVRKIGFNLGINEKTSMSLFKNFLFSLNKAYNFYDILLLEINPFIKTHNNKIIPIDVKITLDKNADFRRKKNFFLVDVSNDNNKENKDNNSFFHKENQINFIKLDGNVGCMVNGAGLAMATMDMIKSCGGHPANFLDIGGSADKKRVNKSFSLILNDYSVKIILINIFGGIVRCDIVAKGIIESYFKINKSINIPLIVRLQGTNEKFARKILQSSKLPIHYVNTLKDASDMIKKILL